MWFSALDYSKNLNREVAFISNDSGYCDDIHPQIQEDIQKHEVKVRLYRTIQKFVEENSQQVKDADEKWAMEVFPQFENDVLVTAGRAFRVRSFGGIVKGGTLRAVSFKDGKVYEIAPKVELAELSFRVEARLDTTTVVNHIPLSDLRSPLGFGGIMPAVLNPTVMGANMGGVFSPVGSGFASIAASPVINAFQPYSLVQKPQTQVGIIEAPYLVIGIARVSARLVNGKITEQELTDFKLEKIEEIASSAESSGETSKPSP